MFDLGAAQHLQIAVRRGEVPRGHLRLGDALEQSRRWLELG